MPLIVFLDAHNEWGPGFLEAVVEHAELYPLAGAYVAGMRSPPDGVPFLEVTLAPPGAEMGMVDQRGRRCNCGGSDAGRRCPMAAR